MLAIIPDNQPIPFLSLSYHKVKVWLIDQVHAKLQHSAVTECHSISS